MKTGFSFGIFAAGFVGGITLINAVEGIVWSSANNLNSAGGDEGHTALYEFWQPAVHNN